MMTGADRPERPQIGRLAARISVLHNNKMQQTRSGHSRWRPSQLILVFSGFLRQRQHSKEPDGQRREARAGARRRAWAKGHAAHPMPAVPNAPLKLGRRISTAFLRRDQRSGRFGRYVRVMALARSEVSVARVRRQPYISADRGVVPTAMIGRSNWKGFSSQRADRRTTRCSGRATVRMEARR
jgi:hypothetical protein